MNAVVPSAVVGIVLATAVVAACSSGSGGSDAVGEVCVSGATQTCTGPGGCLGGQACLSNGQGYDDCICAEPPEAASDASDAQLPPESGANTASDAQAAPDGDASGP